MLRTDEVLNFCDKTGFFTSKPKRNCLLEAMRLDISFGLFIKENMVSGTRFDSIEEFLSCYHQFSLGFRQNVS